MEIKRGQDIIDAAVIATGRSEAAIEVAIANGVSLTSYPAAELAGTVATLNPAAELAGTVAVNKQVKNMLAMSKTEPATGVSEADEAAAPYRGVGFWAIEEDFVIDN